MCRGHPGVGVPGASETVTSTGYVMDKRSAIGHDDTAHVPRDDVGTVIEEPVWTWMCWLAAELELQDGSWDIQLLHAAVATTCH
jgi:hypothetical protein